MSLSEIFDHGAAHPWANLRINNLTVDGTITGGTGGGNQGTLNITFSGPFTTQVFNVDFQKFGKQVTLQFPNVTASTVGTNNSPIASSTVLPASLLPDFITGSGTTSINYPVVVENNNSIQPSAGLLQITNTGNIFIYLTLGQGTFSSAATKGMIALGISYLSAT
jgi:hypothetical protein